MKPTKETLQEMTKNSRCIDAVEAVFTAKAYTETIRDIVEPEQRRILQQHQFLIDGEHVGNGREQKVITNPKDLFLLSDQDFKIYEKEIHDFYIQEGFNVKYGYCPLLIAENIERDAKKAMIDIFQPYIGIDFHGLLCAGLDAYNHYVDINLRFFAPYIDKEKLKKENA